MRNRDCIQAVSPLKKDNEYSFNVRLNLKKPDHRKAYNRLMNRRNQSMNDCVVEALCHMGDPYAQTLQQDQLQAAVRKELENFFQDWKPPETMAAESRVTGTDSAPTEEDLAAAMAFMNAL